MIRPVLVSLLVVVAVVTVALVALWAGQRRLIYFPDPAAPRPTGDAREVVLRTSDGLRLVSWLVPPTGVDRNVAVLVAPGNGGNRGDRTPLASALTGAGLTVLLLDYRGYGGNPGSPSEAGLGRDARAALTYLTGAAGFPRTGSSTSGRAWVPPWPPGSRRSTGRRDSSCVPRSSIWHRPAVRTTPGCRSGCCCVIGIRSPSGWPTCPFRRR